MTTPNDPFGRPGSEPPPPPGYGPAPGSDAAPGYGTPPGYGAPPAYGAPMGTPAAYGGYGSPAVVPGQLAQWPVRVASTLIDAVAVGLIAAILVGIGAAVNSALLAVLGYLVALGLGVWNYWRQGESGQTIGKQVMGTYLVRESDGQYVGGGMSIVRAIAHAVDSIPCYIGYLWPLWDTKRQTFADKIVGTLVVKR